MAKRSAEPLLGCAPPWKRLLLEPCSRPPKRKMEPAEELGAERSRQRPRADTRSRSADSSAKRARAAAPEESGPQPGGDGESQRRGSTELRRRSVCGAQDQEGDECWQYNSFHYWRVPLPNIDLSEFLELDAENITEEVAPNSAEGAEVEMES